MLYLKGLVFQIGPSESSRFFTGLYTAILPPAITVLIQHWFLDTELCRINAVGRRHHPHHTAHFRSF
jgi:hypothetical protein